MTTDPAWLSEHLAAVADGAGPVAEVLPVHGSPVGRRPAGVALLRHRRRSRPRPQPVYGSPTTPLSASETAWGRFSLN
jgi:hypothetical protein